ncbi:MAG: hypothetical protein GY940_17435 [bacterium]|nr:hypothetical protein [bacterium]
MVKTKEECPCGSGQGYKDCCRPFHKGNKTPKTAEALMRARYSAYVKGRVDFLLDTWHPSTRPGNFQLDSSLQWTGLEIHSTDKGTPADSLGFVTFTAHYIKNGMPMALSEAGDFIRQSSQWFYLKGEIKT